MPRRGVIRCGIIHARRLSKRTLRATYCEGFAKEQLGRETQGLKSSPTRGCRLGIRWVGIKVLLLVTSFSGILNVCI